MSASVFCRHEPDLGTIMYGIHDVVAQCKRCGRMIYRWSEEYYDAEGRHPVVWALA